MRSSTMPCIICSAGTLHTLFVSTQNSISLNHQRVIPAKHPLRVSSSASSSIPEAVPPAPSSRKSPKTEIQSNASPSFLHQGIVLDINGTNHDRNAFLGYHSLRSKSNVLCLSNAEANSNCAQIRSFRYTGGGEHWLMMVQWAPGILKGNVR